jgi:prolyl-tRNA editing enzyme YbaK/EbsC (Cys-tRNA(Pro) deacylase)
MQEDSLENLLNMLGGKLIHLDTPVKTVAQAAKAVSTSPKNIIKSLVFMTEKEGPVLIIIDGSSKVDIKKLEMLFGSSRLANPTEVKKYTGYEIGGVPPVGVKIKTYVDPKVLENNFVYGGGGSSYKLCRIDPKRIVEFQEAKVISIAMGSR